MPRFGSPASAPGLVGFARRGRTAHAQRPGHVLRPEDGADRLGVQADLEAAHGLGDRLRPLDLQPVAGTGDVLG
jgi:hypothetical protein